VTISPPWISERTPSMFRYSCLFALVYFGSAVVIGLLAQRFAPAGQRSNGSFAHFVVLLGAFVTGWVFVRREKRLFTASEQRRIVAWCIGWLIPFEALGLLSFVGQLRRLPVAAVSGVLVFTLLIDGLIVWVSFRYVVRKVMAKRVPAPESTV
jgi:hypothetical protein